MTAFVIGSNLFLFMSEEKGKRRVADLLLIVIPLAFILLVNPRMNALIITRLKLKDFRIFMYHSMMKKVIEVIEVVLKRKIQKKKMKNKMKILFQLIMKKINKFF